MHHKQFHILAIDFESWVFSKKINSQNLSLEKLRILDDGYALRALDYILSCLRKHRKKTTFFVVTKLEEMYPGILEKILKEGHEIGWHSYSHRRVDNKDALIGELTLSEKYIRKYNMKGFQAPEIIFFRGGYKILKDFGFLYSSSVYGNSGKIYSFDGVYELPVSTSNQNYKPDKNSIVFPSSFTFSKLFQYGIPYGSSFFWGFLGKNYYSKQLKEAESQNRFCNLFIHDWQLIKPESKEYKKDVSFFCNPLFLPYKIPVKDLFEYLLSHFDFKPMNSLFL